MSDPVAGDVWRYPYLWGWQADLGETEGRKDRPVAVVAAVYDDKGNRHLAMLAITSQPPGKGRLSLEVPLIEARRAGLTTTQSLWVILDEANYDHLGMSYYFEPDGRIGALSASFLSRLSQAFRVAIVERKTRRIRRDT